jgi:vesicle coat complex subunit
LCSKRNAEIILKELIEYGRDIDAVIARKAIKCIGDIATMVNMAADKTIRALMKIVKNSSTQDHILNEASITFSEILRRYP